MEWDIRNNRSFKISAELGRLLAEQADFLRKLNTPLTSSSHTKDPENVSEHCSRNWSDQEKPPR